MSERVSECMKWVIVHRGFTYPTTYLDVGVEHESKNIPNVVEHPEPRMRGEVVTKLAPSPWVVAHVY